MYIIFSKDRQVDKYLFNLVGGVVLKQDGLVLLLGGQHTPIHRLVLSITSILLHILFEIQFVCVSTILNCLTTLITFIPTEGAPEETA